MLVPCWQFNLFLSFSVTAQSRQSTQCAQSRQLIYFRRLLSFPHYFYWLLHGGPREGLMIMMQVAAEVEAGANCLQAAISRREADQSNLPCKCLWENKCPLRLRQSWYTCVYCVVIELRVSGERQKCQKSKQCRHFRCNSPKDRQPKSYMTERRGRYSFAGAVEVEVSAEQPWFSFSFFSP